MKDPTLEDMIGQVLEGMLNYYMANVLAGDMEAGGFVAHSIDMILDRDSSVKEKIKVLNGLEATLTERLTHMKKDPFAFAKRRATQKIVVVIGMFIKMYDTMRQEKLRLDDKIEDVMEEMEKANEIMVEVQEEMSRGR
jgi:prefoldin subunit 5